MVGNNKEIELRLHHVHLTTIVIHDGNEPKSDPVHTQPYPPGVPRKLVLWVKFCTA